MGTATPVGPPVRVAGAVAVEVPPAERDDDVRRRAARGERGRGLLADCDELRAREGVVQEVSEPRNPRGGLKREELVAREARGHEERPGALTEDVVDVALNLVRPAHVLRQYAGGENVVRDHRLGAHVPEVGVAVVDAVLHEHADVVHVERVDVVRPHLVHDDDEHARRAFARGLRGCGRHETDGEDEQHQGELSEPASHFSSPCSPRDWSDATRRTAR